MAAPVQVEVYKDDVKNVLTVMTKQRNPHPLDASHLKIGEYDRVIFPPSYVAEIFTHNIYDIRLNNNGIIDLSRIFLPNTLIYLNLSGNQISNLRGISFPRALSLLNLSFNNIISLEDVIFPSDLTTLHLYENKIKSLKGIVFPMKIKCMSLVSNKIISLKGCRFPPNLKELDLSFNPYNLKNISFPVSIQYLNLYQTYRTPPIQIPDVEGVFIGRRTNICCNFKETIWKAVRETSARRIQRMYRRWHIKRYAAATKIQAWWVSLSFNRRGVVFKTGLARILDI